MSQTVVIAIGGNAITKNGQKGTVEEQMQNIRDCCDPILDLVQAGYRIPYRTSSSAPISPLPFWKASHGRIFPC